MLQIVLMIATVSLQWSRTSRQGPILRLNLVEEICLGGRAYSLLARIDHVLKIHLLRSLINLNTPVNYYYMVVTFPIVLLCCFIDIS